MYESTSGLIAPESCNSWKVSLVLLEENGKIDFTHILAKIHTTLYAGRHLIQSQEWNMSLKVIEKQ